MTQEYARILIGTDGSDEAQKALRKAIALSKQNQATLLIAHVVDTRSYKGFETFDGTLSDQTRKKEKALLEDYRLVAQEAGLENVETILKYGSPKKILAKELPHDKQIDLIVMGATGLNVLDRVLIGSVSGFVMQNAVCDVLIVRTDMSDNSI